VKLEKEIQQKKFKSIEQKLMLNIHYTNNWLNAKNESLFKQADVTMQQYNVLRILRGQYPKPCNIKLIKERMLDKMSDTSRIVDKLYNKGFLQRKQSAEDRRNVDVLITKKGLALLSSLDVMDDAAKQLFTTLSTSEINTLNDLLDKLRGE